MVLNAAAMLVVGARRRDHITPVLCDVLHWLSVHQRIQFKIVATAFDLRPWHRPSIAFFDACSWANLRSAHRGNMFVPWIRTQLDRRRFMLLLQLSGTVFFFICAHHPSVEDISDLDWTPCKSSTKPTLHLTTICFKRFIRHNNQKVMMRWSRDSLMRWTNVTGKMSIGVVKFYNHGAVQAVIGICV